MEYDEVENEEVEVVEEVELEETAVKDEYVDAEIVVEEGVVSEEGMEWSPTLNAKAFRIVKDHSAQNRLR